MAREHGRPRPPVPAPSVVSPNWQNTIQLAHWSERTPTPGLTTELDGDGFVDLIPGGMTWFECDPASIDVEVPSVLCIIGMGMNNIDLRFASCTMDKSNFFYSAPMMFGAKGSMQWNIYRVRDANFDGKKYLFGIIGSGKVRVWAQIV